MKYLKNFFCNLVLLFKYDFSVTNVANQQWRIEHTKRVKEEERKKEEIRVLKQGLGL